MAKSMAVNSSRKHGAPSNTVDGENGWANSFQRACSVIENAPQISQDYVCSFACGYFPLRGLHALIWGKVVIFAYSINAIGACFFNCCAFRFTDLAKNGNNLLRENILGWIRLIRAMWWDIAPRDLMCES